MNKNLDNTYPQKMVMCGRCGSVKYTNGSPMGTIDGASYYGDHYCRDGEIGSYYLGDSTDNVDVNEITVNGKKYRLVE